MAYASRIRMNEGRIAHFRLISELGRDVLGVSYRAFDESLQREVCLKVLDQQLLQVPAVPLSFIKEANAAASINDAHVIQIYFTGQSEETGTPYVVTEFCEGQTLAELIAEKSRLPEPMVLTVGIEAVMGLMRAYENGIVHGDLNPGQILISGDKGIKLLNFGFTRTLELIAKLRGELWGEPHYIPPERVKGVHEDHRSDIFTLGGTLYHAISGLPPYSSRDVNTLVSKRLKEKTTELINVVPGIHASTSKIISRMLDPDPLSRYQNYLELLNELQDAQSQKVVKTNKVQSVSNRAQTAGLNSGKPVPARVSNDPDGPKRKKNRPGNRKYLVASGCLLLVSCVFFFAKNKSTSEPSFKEVNIAFANKLQFGGKSLISLNDKQWLLDGGDVFSTQLNGYMFGWNGENEKYLSRSLEGIPHPFYLNSNELPDDGSLYWELAVPNGRYSVFLAGGDAGYAWTTQNIEVEGVIALSGVSTSDKSVLEGKAVVQVTDGRLTVRSAEGSFGNRPCFIQIKQAENEPLTKTPAPPKIKRPLPSENYAQGSSVALEVDTSTTHEFSRLTFYINNTKIHEEVNAPYPFTWKDAKIGLHTIRVTGEMKDGQTILSLPVAIKVTSPNDREDPNVLRINFQAGDAPLAAEYLVDKGLPYGDRGNDYEYGWMARGAPAESEGVVLRDWVKSRYALDERYNSWCLFSKGSFNAKLFWEIKVPNGKYRVRIVFGLPGINLPAWGLKVEDLPTSILKASNTEYWVDEVLMTEVKDGKLTVGLGQDYSGYENINFIEIFQLGSAR